MLVVVAILDKTVSVGKGETIMEIGSYVIILAEHPDGILLVTEKGKIGRIVAIEGDDYQVDIGRASYPYWYGASQLKEVKI